MNQGKYIFSQIMELISHKRFQTLVNRHSGDYKVQDFTCWKQFLCMVFGQLTHRESITDTLLCLKANANKLYHLGIGHAVAVSTLTRANENRSCQIYEDVAMMLIEEANRLYIKEDSLEVDIKNNVFAIDSTTIDLCLNVFWWANFRTTKAGIKLHTQLDLKTAIPQFILFSGASTNDVNFIDYLHFEAGSFYILDKGYIDFKRLYHINECKAFFVTRAKENMNYRRVYSHPKETTEGIVFDQSILLNNYYPSERYPEKLRLIKYKDEATGKVFLFLTNNFEVTAADITQIYKHRWKIELFFKWIKQHLKVKSFWGQSENAVKTQVWIAVSAYVLVAIAKKKYGLKQSLYEILQIISISIFDKTHIQQLFQQSNLQSSQNNISNQLTIFDL